MRQKEIPEITDQEIIKASKQVKPTKIYDAVIFGFLVGIAIYSTIVIGFGLLTFLPLIYPPIAKGIVRKERN